MHTGTVTTFKYVEGGPRKTIAGASLKYQFVYLKIRIFKCSCRNFIIHVGNLGMMNDMNGNFMVIPCNYIIP